MSDHSIVHIEFSTKDRKVSKKFYGDIFGWKFLDYDEMNYTTFETGDGVGGGFSPVSKDNPAGTVIVHIHTDDVTATLQKIKAAGGTVVLPETDIPNTGKYGLFRDPAGNLVGLFKEQMPPG